MVTKRKAYQRFAAGGAVKALDVAPDLQVDIDNPAAHVAADHGTEAMLDHIEGEDTSASAAFQKQVDALRQSEQLQRDHATMSREEKSQHWRDNGIGGDDLEYLHQLEDNPHVTVMAVADARKQGHPEDTDQFHQAVKSNFRKLLPQLKQSDPVRELEAAYQVGDVKAQAEITDRISKANTRAAKDEDDDYLNDPSRARRLGYSAPVSHAGTMATSGGSYGGDRPGRVTLSVLQKEAAKIAGISESEYAQQVLRLRAEKAEGNHGGSP